MSREGDEVIGPEATTESKDPAKQTNQNERRDREVTTVARTT